MAEKPPIQKPPVRAATGGYPPPQPVYQPVYAQPVYYPPPPLEPPQATAPSTSFLAVLGWTSIIWAVGLALLCMLLRYVGSDDFGLSIANVSMYLSFALIPIAFLVGLFAIFEIGRETTGDAPRPTLTRFAISSAILVLGIVGQVGFARYLTSSAAAELVEKMAGVWERTDGAPPGQFGEMIVGTEMKAAHDPFGEDAPPKVEVESPEPEWTVEFTKGGTVIVTSPQGSQQNRYDATGNKTFSVKEGHFQRDFDVDFPAPSEMIIRPASWFANQSPLSGRYRKFGASAIDPSIPQEFADDLLKLRGQLREYELRSKKLMSAQGKFERDRTDLTQQLRNLGVQSANDANKQANPIVKIKVNELVGITRDLKAVESKRKDCERMIEEIQSTLRGIERKIALKQADVAEFGEVSAKLIELKERMSDSTDTEAVRALNDQVLLEEALGN